MTAAEETFATDAVIASLVAYKLNSLFGYKEVVVAATGKDGGGFSENCPIYEDYTEQVMRRYLRESKSYEHPERKTLYVYYHNSVVYFTS